VPPPPRPPGWSIAEVPCELRLGAASVGCDAVIANALSASASDKLGSSLPPLSAGRTAMGAAVARTATIERTTSCGTGRRRVRVDALSRVEW
jgi:hypothetical protein